MKKLLIILIMSLAGLILLGVLFLYSATVREHHPERFYNHIKWLAIGLPGCAIAASVRYTRLRSYHIPEIILGVAILLLGLVLHPRLSLAINGAHRWFSFGQPSEFAKLALILALADFTARNLASMDQFKRGFLWPVSWAGLVALLIFLEPDWGTSILTGAVAMIILTVGGTRWRYVFAAALMAGILIYYQLQRHPEKLSRLHILVEQEKTPLPGLDQVRHSVYSFARGGITGEGVGLGKHKYDFVPEEQTDFILTLIGEERGLVGTSTVVGLFLCLVMSGILIGWRVHDSFGQLLVWGIVFTIGLQAVINIGVVTNILPNKGLPLPFISYGGSNLVCLLIGIGLVISVGRFAPRADVKTRPVLECLPQSETSEVFSIRPSNPPVRQSILHRMLLRLCFGPYWPYWLAIHHDYQRPPAKRLIRPPNLRLLRQCWWLLSPELQAKLARHHPSVFSGNGG